MKGKHLLSFILVLAINAMAFGQKNEDFSPEDKAKKMTEKMADKLELSPEQKTAVYEANLKMINEMIKQKEMMKAAKEAHKAQMAEILDETQQKQLKKMNKQRAKRKRIHKERVHHRRKTKDAEEAQEGKN